MSPKHRTTLFSILPWALLVGLMVWVVSGTQSQSDMLKDTDTIGILTAIEKQGNPLYWFTHDWPLQNHFYRPISTLAFELDHQIGPWQTITYGRTNAVLVALTVLSTFLLGRIVLKSSMFALLGAGLMAFWSSRFFPPDLVPIFVPVLSLIGVVFWVRGQRNISWQIIGLTLLLGFFLDARPDLLPFRMMGWIPGRTASVMAVFATPALAMAVQAVRQRSWAWGAGAVVLAFLALGSYEQAIMLLPILGVLLWQARQLKPIVGWLSTGLVVSATYVFVRTSFVSSAVSRYQDQQFRTGQGIFLTLSDYGLPVYRDFLAWRSALSVGWSSFLLAEFWLFPLYSIALGLGIWAVWKCKTGRTIGALFAASFIAMFPMAFLKPFEHYDFWPHVFRALALAAVAQALFQIMNSHWRTIFVPASKTLENPETPPDTTPAPQGSPSS